MGKILEKYNPPRLNYKIINIRPTTSRDSASVTENFPSRESPRPDGFMAEFYQIFKQPIYKPL